LNTESEINRGEMTKCSIILVMLCLVGNTLRAQHFFNKREMYHSFSCVSNSSIEKNNKHYILNVSLDNTYFQGQGQLPYAFSIRTLVLNQQGDILYNN